jgi:hypothetical protein
VLEEREIDVDVQRLGLKGREAVSDSAEDTAHLFEMVEAFGKREVFQIVAECLQNLAAFRRRAAANFRKAGFPEALSFSRNMVSH